MIYNGMVMGFLLYSIMTCGINVFSLFLFQKRNLSLVLQTAVHFTLYVPFAVASTLLLWTSEGVEKNVMDPYDSFDYIDTFSYLSSAVSQ